MMLRWVALILVVACTSPTSSIASSGGETRVEVSDAPAAEEAEVASALDNPPPGTSSVQTATTPEAIDTAGSSTATTETVQPAASTRPTTILAPARSGRVRLSDVHEVIRNHGPEVSGCYEEGLSRDRALAGEAKVRFLIGPRGRIEDAEVYESTLGDGVVEECILTAMRGWRFPRPRPRGSSVLMTYPYSLATE